MISIKKYAAIDIGSNAIRLLVSNVIITKDTAPQFKESALVRVPIRLGADSFVEGTISEKNTNRMMNAIKAFKLLMNVHGVESYKACATSAMREASNGLEIIEKIYQKTGVKINIISGKEEAEIISSTDLHELISGDKSYLYVDVGGGSTEFTIFSKGKIIISKSFKIGTVRILNNKKEENKDAFKKIENWTLWIIGNIASIPLYFVKGYGFTGIQYFIFLILAILAYKQWKKILNNNRQIA